jgi:DNA-binding NarL/FixJ family response regulator
MREMRTLITDDNGTMRKAMRAALDGYLGIRIVGEAANGEEAIEQVRALHPDLVIMDISMPRLGGLAAAEQIKRLSAETDILIFSIHKLKEFVDSAKRMGLSGFVMKEEGGAGLLSAISDVIHHLPHFPT